MDIRLPKNPQFNKYYTKHCKYLKLKSLQQKTMGPPYFAIFRLHDKIRIRTEDHVLAKAKSY